MKVERPLRFVGKPNAGSKTQCTECKQMVNYTIYIKKGQSLCRNCFDKYEKEE